MFDSASLFNDTVDLFHLANDEEQYRQPTILKQHRIDQLTKQRSGLTDYDREHLFTYLLQGE